MLAYFPNVHMKNVNFCSNERQTNMKLDPKEHHVMNCCYFIRPDSDNPKTMLEAYAPAAMSAKKTEMKIWGCSDMSSFLSNAIFMQKNLGQPTYKRLFSDIELIDIDHDIVNRAKKGVVGLTQTDMGEINQYLGVNYRNYFQSAPDKDFFLRGEPNNINGERIHPHKIADELLEGVKIRQGDIRQDVKNLSAPQPGVRRIFDFSNSWYFMNKQDQANLACDFSEKMQRGDILTIGRVEHARDIPDVLERVGFSRKPWTRNIFVKTQDLSKEHLDSTRRFIVQCAEHLIG
jgi:chemotaxis methyl-accepting protein methylase